MRIESVEAHATRASVAPVQVQAQTAVGEEVPDLARGPRLQRPEPHALAQQPPQPRRGRLAGPQVAARELPEASEEPRRRPADREGAPAADEQRGDGLDLARRRARAAPRQRLGVAARERPASAGHRARGAARRAGGADGRPELHQRLVQVSGARAAGELARAPPEPGLHRRAAQVLANAVQAGQHARDVAVDDRLRPVERDRRDGPRGVAADAWQLAHRVGAVGQAPGVPQDDLARRALEVSRARVVAEPRPVPEHRIRLGAREAVDVGEAREEALVVGDHRIDARLLSIASEIQIA